MKVTTNTPPQLNQANQTATAEKTNDKAKNVDRGSGATRSTTGASPVEISDDARLLQKTTQTIRELPNVSNEKVSALKKSIADGTYRVDSGAIADKLLEEHLSTHFGKNSF